MMLGKPDAPVTGLNGCSIVQPLKAAPFYMSKQSGTAENPVFDDGVFLF